MYVCIYTYIYILPEGPVDRCVEQLGRVGAAGRGRWAHNGTPNHCMHVYKCRHACMHANLSRMRACESHHANYMHASCKLHASCKVRLDEIISELTPADGVRLRDELYLLVHTAKMEAERRRIASVPRRPPDMPPMQRGSKSRGGKRKALAVLDGALMARCMIS